MNAFALWIAGLLVALFNAAGGDVSKIDAEQLAEWVKGVGPKVDPDPVTPDPVAPAAPIVLTVGSVPVAPAPVAKVAPTVAKGKRATFAVVPPSVAVVASLAAGHAYCGWNHGKAKPAAGPGKRCGLPFSRTGGGFRCATCNPNGGGVRGAGVVGSAGLAVVETGDAPAPSVVAPVVAPAAPVVAPDPVAPAGLDSLTADQLMSLLRSTLATQQGAQAVADTAPAPAPEAVDPRILAAVEAANADDWRGARPCLNCGTGYAPRTKWQKYCGPECRQAVTTAARKGDKRAVAIAALQLSGATVASLGAFLAS